MGEVAKPDDLVRRIDALERNLNSITATMWRRQRIIDDTATTFTVSSAAYGDPSGVPLVLRGVTPGPTGIIIVGISAWVNDMPQAAGFRASFTVTNGPSGPFSSSDSRALIIDGDLSGPGVDGAVTRFAASPVLEDGAYDITWQCRATSGTINVFSRGLITIAV